MNNNQLRVFTGSSNPSLFEKFFQDDDPESPWRGNGSIDRFSDGELFFSINESVRGVDCYILQSTCYPQNDNLMELCIIADTLKRAAAANVTAVIPYFGYARQDRQVAPRTPITAKLVANMITTSGVDRVVILDVHSSQTQGFFNTPLFDNLHATSFLCDYLSFNFNDWNSSNTIVVSPDVGGVKRARNFSKKLGGCGLAIIDKRRDKPNESEVMNIIGDVVGKNCILVDDMIDTAGTICQAASALVEAGALKIIGCATHPILSGPAIERINESPLSELIVSDSVPFSKDAMACNKIKSTSCAPILRMAIDRIHRCGSISKIFG